MTKQIKPGKKVKKKREIKKTKEKKKVKKRKQKKTSSPNSKSTLKTWKTGWYAWPSILPVWATPYWPTTLQNYITWALLKAVTTFGSETSKTEVPVCYPNWTKEAVLSLWVKTAETCTCFPVDKSLKWIWIPASWKVWATMPSSNGRNPKNGLTCSITSGSK